MMPGSMAGLGAWLGSRRFSARAFLTFGTNTGISLIGVCSGLMLARFLGPAGRGELAAIQLWPALLASLAVFGMGDAVAYFAARRQRQAAAFLWSGMPIVLVIAVVTAFAGYAAMPWLLRTHDAATLAVARMFLAMIPIQVVLMLAFACTRGLERTVQWNLLRLSQPASWLVIILVLVSADRCTPGTLALCHVAVQFAFAVGLLGIWSRRAPASTGFSRVRAKQLLRFSMPGFVSQLPQLVGRNADQILLLSLVPAGMLGRYVVAGAWGGIAGAISLAITPLVLPRMSGVARGAMQLHLIRRLVGSAVTVIVPVGVVTALLAPVALPALFGHQYLDVTGVAAVMAGAATIAGISRVLAEVLRSLRAFRALILAETAGLVVTTTGTLGLVDVWGLTGVSLAVLAGQVSAGALIVRALCAATGMRAANLLLPVMNPFSGHLRDASS